MIDLTFFGRGAAFYPAMGNTSAYFTKGKNLFFLDCGESVFAKAERDLDLTTYEDVYVILTHLHADHVGSLASLCSYCFCLLHKQVTVVHPVATVVELLRLQGIDHRFYRYLAELPQDLGVTAEAIEVRHAEDMRCFGYLISDGEETVYYSGDSVEPPQRVLQALRAGTVQRVYHDTASAPSQSHCYVKRLEDAIPVELRHKVYAMHLDCDCEAALKKKGFSVVQAAV